jgi:phenylacetate-CoA ligase
MPRLPGHTSLDHRERRRDADAASTGDPEYLTHLAKVYRDDFGRDVRDLGTRFIASFLGPDTDGHLRRDLEALWGCKVYDNYGTHEIGLAAFECPAQDGLHLQEDLLYFEVSDVDSNRTVSDGHAGNLIVTNLFRTASPLIRLNLRDLGRIAHTDRCACGGTLARMDKFLGRSDDMVKVRGVNIYPMACLAAVKSDPRTTGEWFCVVDRHHRDGDVRDEMQVRVEVRSEVVDTEGLKDALERRLQSDLTLRVEVELVEEGALAEQANLGREGKPKRLLDRRTKGGGINSGGGC